MHTPITEPARLAEQLHRIPPGALVGLDTEFLRERTYYAQLCLLQVATADDAYCIDALALVGSETTPPGELTLLQPMLRDASICKIMHAARQDMEVLWPHVGVVSNVFDTQLAAAMIGAPAQVGYGALVAELLGVQLEKSQTRTDWSRRPLSVAQIDYALDDVRHLLPLHATLTERLNSLGRRAWFEEDSRRAESTDGFQVDPNDAWQRFKGFTALDEHRQRLAKSLAAWREQRAMNSDRPRGWLLPDAALREIVMRVPRSGADLSDIAELPDGIRNNSGTQLLQIVSDAQVPCPPPPLPQRTRPDAEFTARVQRLADTARRAGGELQLAPELLATRRELERIVGGDLQVLPLQGWRRQVVGEKLLAAL
jgi:ribonuclease D